MVRAPHRLAHLHIRNRALQRARQVDVEQGPVQALDDSDLRSAGVVSLALTQRLVEIAFLARLVRHLVRRRRRGDGVLPGLLQIPRAALPPPLLVLGRLRRRRGTVLPAELGHAEDGLPSLVCGGATGVLGGRVPEPGGGEGALGPAVVDAGDVPVHLLRGGVAVQLVAHVDQVLDGSDVDVVDGREVEDDGFEGGAVRLLDQWVTTAWAWVVPGAVLESEYVSHLFLLHNGSTRSSYTWRGIRVGVGASGLLEDVGDHVIKVMVCVRVVEAFRETIDEYAWVGRLQADFWVRPVLVING